MRLRSAEAVGLFYYAGHGVQVDGERVVASEQVGRHRGHEQQGQHHECGDHPRRLKLVAGVEDLPGEPANAAGAGPEGEKKAGWFRRLIGKEA